MISQERNKEVNLILIGAAGHQGKEYFNLLKNKYNFSALIDSDFETLQKIYDSKKYLLLQNIHDLKENIDYDIAIICLPHYIHKEVTIPIIALNKTVIKEKPLAINSSDIKDYLIEMKKHSNYKLFTIVQRNFNPSFQEAKANLNLIGKIYNFSYDYELNFENKTSGWRADYNKSFGGVLIDMGYHILDIVLSFFDGLISFYGISSYCYTDMKMKNLEDSVNIIMEFKDDISGVININRHSHIKKELFVIRGDKGIIEITSNQYTICDRKGTVLLKKELNIPKEQIQLMMFEFFIKHQNDNQFLLENFKHHSNIVFVIDKIYQQIRNKKNNERFLLDEQCFSLNERKNTSIQNELIKVAIV